ncbi:hypothetical protein [Absidia glauca]|uniref:Chromatin target of PRMT1 protein C-terminal domain-containing protein n=1 Tax=Absidia glauca TaxID=4829 RepID=A0A163IQY7_ABSGL|nr:hypothetical protein [Absidia glauca]
MSHFLRAPQDRRITTVNGGLNERFGRLEKSAPVSKPKPNAQAPNKSNSVFSRIGRTGGPSSSPTRRPLPSGIQSRLGRISNGGGGAVQKREANPLGGRVKLREATTGLNRGKQRTPIKTKGRQQTRKASRSADRPGSKKEAGRGTGKGKKSMSANDLDKALDTYMMKDPKVAQTRLDDELDSYMGEAGEMPTTL